MDELEFRRQLLADPQARQPEMQQQLQHDLQRQRYQQELLEMEQKLKQSLQLPVPSDLADRLLLAQGIASFSERKQQRQRWSSLAACHPGDWFAGTCPV